MSWIVVLESEGRQADSLRAALAADGWQVEIAKSIEAATKAVAARSAQLVVANAEAPKAAEFLRDQSRAQGGPGSVALVAPGKKGSPAALAADERLARPFDDNELRLMVRRLVTAARAPKTPPPAENEARLTSKDLFGEMVDEVEKPVAARPAAPPAPASALPPPPAPAPTPTPALTSTPVPSSSPAQTESLDRQVSGLRQAEKSRPQPVKRAETGVDDLLSKTLSGLEAAGPLRRPSAPRSEGISVASPTTTPAAPAPKAPEPPPPIRLGAQPAPPPATPKPVPSPAAAVPPVVSAVPPAVVGGALSELTPSKRASKELDLSSLDVLAKGPGREKTPTAPAVFETQKIAFQPTLRGGPAPMEFGQYTLQERIALGGMAEVWKARRKGVEGFQKTVAIKKILPHLTDSSDFVTMFIDEAKLAAQLNHTNIIHIFDLGKIGEDFFIAMEFVDGKDMRSTLNAARDKKQPLPLGLALLVASRLASALDYAHRKKDFEGRELGLVHRDVSPQNVLISYEGDIKLCDFGIVKAVSKASKTQMGALKGKLQYMSPEQAWGRPVDARSDIFSLGTLLFEMLTGQRLFSGESEMSVLDAVREGRVQAPRDLDPRLPLEVNALVLKALAREPKNRFASAGDLHREIDAIAGSLRPTPTQHDLAHYMQRLFETEPRAAAPEVAAPAAAAPAAVEPLPVSAPAVPVAKPAPAVLPLAALPPALGRADDALESASSGGRNLLWIGIGAAAVLGLVAYLLFGRKDSLSAPLPAPTAVEETTLQAPIATPAPVVEPALPPPGEAGTTETAAPAEDAAARSAEEERRREAEKKAREALASAAKLATAALASTRSPAVLSSPAVASEPAPPAVEPAPTAQETNPEPTPVAPTPEVAPAKIPTVREGDLVAGGPGVKAPVLVSFKKPEYPPIARRMKVEGTVVVALLVDENGRVIDARLQSGVSQNVGINEAAMAAARAAQFQPATKDGVRVKFWHTLRIPFKL